MKRLAYVLLAAVVAVGAFFLGRMTAPMADSKTFYAVIDQTDGEHFTVSGLEVNDVNHRWQFRFTAGENTQILWNGEELTPQELQVGDTIAVTYAGAVQETSPAGIRTVLKIELLEDAR